MLFVFSTVCSSSRASLPIASQQMSYCNPLSAFLDYHGVSYLLCSVLICRCLAVCWCLCWSSLLPAGSRRVGLFLFGERPGVCASCLAGSILTSSMIAWAPTIDCGRCLLVASCWHTGPFDRLIADLASRSSRARWFWSRSAVNYRVTFDFHSEVADTEKN